MRMELTINITDEQGEGLLEKFYDEGGLGLAVVHGKELMAEITEHLVRRYLQDPELKLLSWEADYI